MTIKLRFEPPIPDGMWIMEAHIEVAGIPHRMGNAVAFARRGQHYLELEREPNNPHDPNAIKVIGVSKGWFFWRRHFLGYVPRETAARVAEMGLWGRVKPRLRSIWAGGYVQDTVYINFDILEPKPSPKHAKTRRRKRDGS
jgi:hypothetical protein